MQIHSTISRVIQQEHRKATTVYQFKGRLPNSFEMANKKLQVFFIPPQYGKKQLDNLAFIKTLVCILEQNWQTEIEHEPRIYFKDF